MPVAEVGRGTRLTVPTRDADFSLDLVSALAVSSADPSVTSVPPKACAMTVSRVSPRSLAASTSLRYFSSSCRILLSRMY